MVYGGFTMSASSPPTPHCRCFTKPGLHVIWESIMARIQSMCLG